MKFEAETSEFIIQKDEDCMKNNSSATAWKLIWSTKFPQKTKINRKL